MNKQKVDSFFAVWTPACLIFDTWHCWQSCRQSPWLNFGNKLCTFSFFFGRGQRQNPAESALRASQGRRGGWGCGGVGVDEGVRKMDSTCCGMNPSSPPPPPPHSPPPPRHTNTKSASITELQLPLVTHSWHWQLQRHSLFTQSFFFPVWGSTKWPSRGGKVIKRTVHFLNVSKTALSLLGKNK